MKICRTCKEPYKKYYKEHNRVCVDCFLEISVRKYIKARYLKKNIYEIYNLMLEISREKSSVMMDCLVNDVKKFIKRTKEHVDTEYNKKMEGKQNVKQYVQ